MEPGSLDLMMSKKGSVILILWALLSFFAFAHHTQAGEIHKKTQTELRAHRVLHERKFMYYFRHFRSSFPFVQSREMIRMCISSGCEQWVTTMLRLASGHFVSHRISALIFTTEHAPRSSVSVLI